VTDHNLSGVGFDFVRRRGIGRWLGVGLTGLTHVLDPERISLGGFFGRPYPYGIEAVGEEIERRRMARAMRNVQVVQARLGSDAVLIGAGELALTSLLDDPTTILLAASLDSDEGHVLPVPTFTTYGNPISWSH
jgi:hypothetical protein